MKKLIVLICGIALVNLSANANASVKKVVKTTSLKVIKGKVPKRSFICITATVSYYTPGGTFMGSSSCKRCAEILGSGSESAYNMAYNYAANQATNCALAQ